MNLNHIKKHIITALVSNDDLMDKLVLKGGNAIGLIYDRDIRFSLDVDFSMQDDFTEDLEELKNKLRKLLDEVDPNVWTV